MGSGVSTAEADPLIPTVNEFSFHFFKVIAGLNADGNLLFSPMSLAAALVLMYLGSRHRTAREINDVMKLEALATPDLHASIAALHKLLFEGGDSCQFYRASKIYYHTDVKLRKKFVKYAQEFYQTDVEETSFADLVTTAQDIDHWIKQSGVSTEDGIIPHDNLNHSDKLVFVNALYFVGKLHTPFQKSSTRIGKFFSSPGESYNVAMMNVKCSFPYFYDGEMRCRVLEMPYDDNHFRIILVLPEVTSGLKDLELRLELENLQTWCRPREMDVVDVYLPRFELSHLIEPTDALGKVGISSLFCGSGADLSGMGDNLHLSGFLHYSRLEVSEPLEAENSTKGNEGDIHAFVVSCETFKADRPFLFLIQDKRKGAIVFMGRVTEPPKIGEEELKEIYKRAKGRLRDQTKGGGTPVS